MPKRMRADGDVMDDDPALAGSNKSERISRLKPLEFASKNSWLLSVPKTRRRRRRRRRRTTTTTITTTTKPFLEPLF